MVAVDSEVVITAAVTVVRMVTMPESVPRVAVEAAVAVVVEDAEAVVEDEAVTPEEADAETADRTATSLGNVRV